MSIQANPHRGRCYTQTGCYWKGIFRQDAVRKGKIFSEPIEIIEPRKIKAALNPISWKILNYLSKEPDFTINLARKLKVHEQKLYYHINQLRKSGLIEVVKDLQ